MERTEVIVVGAGPVGLAAALGLARQGISIIVLDGDPPPLPCSEDEGQGVFAPVDLSPPAPFFPYTGPVLVRSAGGDLLLEAARAPASAGVFALGGQRLRQHLLAQLGQYPHVQIFWDHTVRELGQRDSEVRVLVMTDEGDRVIEGAFLIGADGVHSTVRRTLGLRWESLLPEGQAEPEQLLQFTVTGSLDSDGFQSVTLLSEPENWAIAAQCDVPGTWHFVCAALTTTGSALKRAQERLAALLPNNVSALQVVDANTVTAQHRVAERYRQGKILLAGDAAHETPVWNGLGLACGLADAHSLSVCLGAVLRGQQDAASLDSYDHSRKLAFTAAVAPLALQLQQAIKRPNLATQEWQALLCSRA